MDTSMSQEQFQEIIRHLNVMDGRLDAVDRRLEHVETNMVSKSDVFQSVLTVQAFTAAVIVGVIVTLNSLGLFG